MANIRKVERRGNGSRPSYAWEVRYRDPQRNDRSKTFRKKAEAEAFADAVETDIDEAITSIPDTARRPSASGQRNGWKFEDRRSSPRP